jgi:hypothetical protein
LWPELDSQVLNPVTAFTRGKERFFLKVIFKRCVILPIVARLIVTPIFLESNLQSSSRVASLFSSINWAKITSCSGVSLSDPELQ